MTNYTELEATLGFDQKEKEELKETVDEIAKETGNSEENIVESCRRLAYGGFYTDEIIALLPILGEFADSTPENITDATDFTIVCMHTFGIDIDDVDGLLENALTMVQVHPLTIGYLETVVRKAGVAAREYGDSPNDVFDWAARTSRDGLDERGAGIVLRGMYHERIQDE